MRPLARGYLHQVAFYIAIVACALLLAKSHGTQALICNFIYSVSLVGLFGISSLYHCREWPRKNYLLLRRVDHAAIFALIAGTSTPLCLLGIKGSLGTSLLVMIWGVAILGIVVVVFWTQGPKWIKALFYVCLGWLAVPLYPEIKSALGSLNIQLLLAGGVVYTIGALVYAIRRPDPWPRFFGYHEIFHLLVVIASGLHFYVIYSLTVSFH
jgi:hemolysin III